jgi:hypothetical protein
MGTAGAIRQGPPAARSGPDGKGHAHPARLPRPLSRRSQRGRRARPVALSLLLGLLACGQSDVELVRDASFVDFADAPVGQPDAGPNQGCVPGGPECANCIDDDADGRIDGFDPHCTSSNDDDESSFDTGIPGDNKDAVSIDCFFDGNSGGGDDKCNLHVCCLLDGPCPANLQPNQFDPEDCTPSPECIANCEPLVPPGCDCFGCCTICNGPDCFDVYTNPAVAPDCDVGVLDDPDRCPACTKIAACSTPCSGPDCILCPGQTPDDLPGECTGATCPDGLAMCTTSADCLSTEFCSTGCCIRAVQ